MKIVFYSLFLTFVLSGCASNQVASETNKKLEIIHQDLLRIHETIIHQSSQQ